MRQFWLALPIILSTIGWSTYVVSIIKGKTKPHKVTRALIFLTSSLNFLGAFTVHAPLSTKLLSAFFVCTTIILFILSLKYGVRDGSRLELWCIITALVGILLWKLSGNGYIAIAFAIGVDFVASIPNIVKTWKKPHTESQWFYVFEILSFIITLATAGVNAKSAFIIYLLIFCIAMVVLINRKIPTTNQ